MGGRYGHPSPAQRQGVGVGSRGQTRSTHARAEAQACPCNRREGTGLLARERPGGEEGREPFGVGWDPAGP